MTDGAECARKRLDGVPLSNGVKRKKPIIGICGGVGAGKSRVAAEFARLGCLVVDSDKLNHEVLLQPDILRVPSN